MLWAEEVVWQNLRGYEKKFDEAEWWTRLQNKPSPKGKRKTKTVNQDVVKEKGFVSYPGRSYGRGILVNFKISDSTLGRERFTIRNQMKS